MEELVPVPFRYNALKHHLQVQQAVIASCRKHQTAAPFTDLLTLGASVMDVYAGALSPEGVAQAVQELLQAAGNFEPQAFRKWIGMAGFREVLLPDRSRWVLRPGDTYARYIHLHPARGSAHTFRAKANVLKTAIAWRCINPDAAEPDTEQLNVLRQQLDLSPVNAADEAAHLKLLLHKLVIGVEL